MRAKCPVCGASTGRVGAAEFEKEIHKLFPKDEFDLFASDPELKFFVHLSGALGCEFKGTLIPCEAASWEESLAIVLDYIEKATKQARRR